MSSVILICGRICAGKTAYAKKLAPKINAVLLSVDEITLALFGQNIGEKHDEIAERTRKYLLGKSAELISVGVSVILDWGFWTRCERQSVIKHFADIGIKTELHYIEVTDFLLRKNIEKRNNAVIDNSEDCYFIDEGLAKKSLNRFEEPTRNEIDVLIQNGWA